MSIRKIRVTLLRVTLLPMVFIALFVWRSWDDDSIADFVVEWGGYLFLITGVAMRLWSLLYIGARKSKRLITEGPYSMCRHPLYIGTVAMAAGVSLCLENILLLIVVMAVIVPVHLLTVLREEKRLEELFGNEYLEYKARTPRFLPAFWKFRSAESIEVSTKAVRRGVVEVMLVMLVPVIGELIEMLHANGTLPVFWTPF